ncbi:MAG: DMT family transporter [Defluviimonas sp.]|uniref:DMT family transporter n=1 Tax=Albidovulum sp. TaxID=1872424 RepID=UPI001D857E4E|nr:DMT family transporter [Paracoccaceae bacterium]MCC0065188.1 DMT family transporter [Defluviimonas sp.]
MQEPTLRDWLSIGLLGLIWGATFMVIAVALRGYGPLTVATARTALGAVTLIGILALRRPPLPQVTAPLVVALPVIGLFSTAVPFFLLSWGQQYVASAFAGLSMAAVPLFVLPLAHLFVPGERLSWRRASAFLAGFLGVVVLTGPEALEAQGALMPRLACLGAALCYAISAIVTRRCPAIDPVLLAATSLTAGALALIPAMLAVEGLPHPVSGLPSLAIILLGLVPTAFAALLRVQLIRGAGPGFMTLTNYQVPLWSVAFGTLVLGETLSPRFFLALGLILGGLALARRH